MKQAFDMKGLQELNRLYNEGYKMKDLAKMFNIHYCTVQKYIWRPRKRGTRGTKKFKS